MLNSSSNNSKFKNLDELKARVASKSGGSKGGGFGGGGFGGGFGAKVQRKQQVIIEEEEEDLGNGRLFDYNMDQVDRTLMPPKDHTKPVMVGVICVVSLVFGGFIGWCWQNVLAERSDVNERIVIAKEVEQTIKPKVDAFQTFAQIFKQRSESLGAGVLEYNADFYNNVIKEYRKYGFVLDVSTELPANAIAMASNAAQNPLADIRGYGAGTSLLSALLDSHISHTEQDAGEIKQLLGTSSATDRNIVYAMKVNAADVLKITEMGSDRMAQAIASTEVFQVKSAITDDAEAAKAFEDMKASGRLSADEIKARTYSFEKPNLGKKAKKGAKDKKDEVVEATVDTSLVLPNRLMYVIADNAGKTQTVFADEIILIERTKLFSGSSNALERYRNRMIQILSILGEIEKSTDGLASRLHVISTEDPL